MSVFEKGQLVWAKVRGFAWWPSVVRSSNRKKDDVIENQVEVLFLEENKVGKVNVKMIVDYEAGYEEYSKAKGKLLSRAIETAQVMHEKKSGHNKTEKNPKEENKSSEKGQRRKNQTNVSLGKRNLQLTEDTTGQNDSPRLSKVEKKQERKREEKLGPHFNHYELLQRRSTRALSKNNEIEVLSEPIIYSVKKMRKHEGHSKRDSSIEGSMNEDSNNFLQTEFCETQIAISSKPDNFEEKKNSKENLIKSTSEKMPNMLAQLETMSRLIKRNSQRKENKSILEEADQEKLSKILDDFQSQITSQNIGNLNQNSLKILNQVVTLLLKNQNFLQIKEAIKDQLVRIKNYFSQENSENVEININCTKVFQIILARTFRGEQQQQNLQETKEDNEASSNQESHIFFRKSVCQKLAKLLEEAYCLEKDPSQELTLVVEGRVNQYFSNTLSDYKKAIKALYKLMKAKLLSVEELKSIVDLKPNEFKSWLKLKVQKFINTHKQSDDIEIEIEQN